MPTLSTHPRTPGRPPDRGVGLLEVLVAVVVLGIVAVPLSGFVVTLLRTVARTEQAATRVGLAVTASSLAGRVVVDDPCSPGAVAAVVAGRVTIPERYTLDVVPDCGDALPVLVVTVVDPAGGVTELYAVPAVAVTP